LDIPDREGDDAENKGDGDESIRVGSGNGKGKGKGKKGSPKNGSTNTPKGAGGRESNTCNDSVGKGSGKHRRCTVRQPDARKRNGRNGWDSDEDRSDEEEFDGIKYDDDYECDVDNDGNSFGGENANPWKEDGWNNEKTSGEGRNNSDWNNWDDISEWSNSNWNNQNNNNAVGTLHNVGSDPSDDPFTLDPKFIQEVSATDSNRVTMKNVSTIWFPEYEIAGSETLGKISEINVSIIRSH
jgi:hypothetical protein